MKNILFLVLYLNFFISWSQDKITSTDIAIKDALKQELKNLKKQGKQMSLLKTKEDFHKFRIKLEKVKKSIKYKETDQFKAIDSIHAKAITFFMGKVLYPLSEFDSMIYYNEYLTKNIPIDKYLARSEGMAGYAKFTTLDFIGALKSYDKSITIIKLADNSIQNKKKIILLLLDLSALYLRFESISNAAEALDLVKLELEEYEKMEAYKKLEDSSNLRNLYTISQLELLFLKGLHKKFLALSETINIKDIKNSLTKYLFLSILLDFSSCNVNNVNTAQQYYQQIYDTKEFDFFTKRNKEIDKNLMLARITMLKGDYKKAKSSIFSDINKMKIRQGSLKFLLLQSQYYEQVGDFKKAYEAHVGYIYKIDSINRTNKKFVIDVANYKISKEISTIRLNKINTEKSTTINNFIILTVSISIVLMLFIILYFLKNKRTLKKN